MLANRVQAARRLMKVLRLEVNRESIQIPGTMNASINPPDSGEDERKVNGLIRFGSPRRSSHDLPLVRWTAWLVVAAVIVLVILVVWGLATHKPSPSFFDGDF